MYKVVDLKLRNLGSQYPLDDEIVLEEIGGQKGADGKPIRISIAHPSIPSILKNLAVGDEVKLNLFNKGTPVFSEIEA
jgi:hypothetical protein